MKTLFEQFDNIETERFFIRALAHQDYQDLYEIFSDFEVVKYQQIPPMESLEIARGATENFIKGYTDKFKIRRAIILEDKMIGIVSLHSFNYETKEVEIGFMVNREHWGQGVMTEAASAVINYVFAHSNAKAVIAKPLPENIGSRKVINKLGFTKIDFIEKGILNFRTNEYEDQLVYKLENNKDRH